MHRVERSSRGDAPRDVLERERLHARLRERRLEPQRARRGVEDPQRLAVSRGERERTVRKSNRFVRRFARGDAEDDLEAPTAGREDDDRVGPAEREGAPGGRDEELSLACRRRRVRHAPERARLLREHVAREDLAARGDHELGSDEPVRDDLARRERDARRGLRTVEREEVGRRRRAEHRRDGGPRRGEPSRPAAPRSRARARGDPETSRPARAAGFAPSSARRPPRPRRGRGRGDRTARDAARGTVRLGVRLGRGDRGGKRRGRARDLGTRNRAHVRREPIARRAPPSRDIRSASSLSPSARRTTKTACVRLPSLTTTSGQTAASSSSRDTARPACRTR